VKEWITGRNPVYETLRAKRRHVFRLMLLRGIKLDGHLPEILNMAKERKVQVLEAQRQQLDAIDTHNQGIADGKIGIFLFRHIGQSKDTQADKESNQQQNDLMVVHRPLDNASSLSTHL